MKETDKEIIKIMMDCWLLKYHSFNAVSYTHLYVYKRQALGFGYLQSFVHIGCTSEDINNTSYSCMLKYGLKDVWLPKAKEFATLIDKWADEHSEEDVYKRQNCMFVWFFD